MENAEGGHLLFDCAVVMIDRQQEEREEERVNQLDSHRGAI
jgi:hypothetical protein